MAPKATSENVLVPSIAQTKLERQIKRNQEIEAALTNPGPLERRSQQPRGKKNRWQPLDLTDATRSTTPSEGGVLVSEVRVNTFRAPSRAGSLSRPVSVLSHRTSETGPSDMDRQDSALTDQGFQVFQRRRHRKNVPDLNAYEDKPEERQTTVEASFDEREVYKVFGNALPAPGVIEENAGHEDGEVRFVQHPNGDVLAYQWSSVRFVWENIGQFSNHRKKVEGQLAADRLKGETAYQSLQRNSLAYFRTIARQREASVMGKPFGAKDIQAALPEPQAELSAAPTGLKDNRHDTIMSQQAQMVPAPGYTPWKLPDHQDDLNDRSIASLQPLSLPPTAPTEPRVDRQNLTSTYLQKDVRHDDPFYTMNSYQQIYGGYSAYPNTYYRYPNVQAQPIPAVPAMYRPQDLQQDFYFPYARAARQNGQYSEVSSPFTEVENFTRQGVEQWQQHTRQAHVPSVQSYARPQYRTTGTVDSSDSSDATTRPTTFQTTMEASRPKPVTPLDRRSAIRDNLWKQAEAAKERSLSQGSILSRTVLYDPLQNQTSAQKAGSHNDPIKEDISPTLNRNMVGKTSQAPSSFDMSSSKYWPVVPAPTIQPVQPTSPAGTTLQGLQDSSPEPYPTKQSYAYHNPTLNTPADIQATPQTFRGPYFAAESGVSTAPIDQKTYDEELGDWWTSGKKFARQEEFYRSVTSTNTRHPSTSSISGLPAQLTPTGHQLRNTKTPNAECDTTATRMLIPMLENLASYVQGPVEKRRDYFSQWKQPPEWCIDRSETGNHSFFDKNWGTPPARVGRDPRYSHSPWVDDRTPLRGRYGSPGGVTLHGSMGGGVGGGYVDRRFGFAGGLWQ